MQSCRMLSTLVGWQPKNPVPCAEHAKKQLSRPGAADGALMSHFLPAQGRGAVPARCCSNWSESNPPTRWKMVLRTLEAPDEHHGPQMQPQQRIRNPLAAV